jgi:glucokinase
MYEVNIAHQVSQRLVRKLRRRAAPPDPRLTRVLVDNDANCAALAEWAYGAGVGAQDLVLVTLGTGIGGGMVIGGRPYRGRHGFAGEFGHMVIEPRGLECPCGQRGCWERYGSGSGLALLGQQAAMISPIGQGIPLRAEDVVAAVRAGSAVGAHVMESFARWVALGLVNLANILDPEIIIVGGGLASEAELFMPEVKRLFGELLYESSHRDHPVIAVAQSDHRAGAIGAAVAASLPA